MVLGQQYEYTLDPRLNLAVPNLPLPLSFELDAELALVIQWQFRLNFGFVDN